MKNQVLEMSSVKNADGRRNIKMVLHTIHEFEEQFNKNGITYFEEFTQRNLESIKGLPLCVSFLDEVKDIPYDHGFTEIKDGLLPVFENSEQVGSFYYGAVEEIIIDGILQKVCVGYGYVNQSRYPKFVEWLEQQIMSEKTVFGSVEFVGTNENAGKIIYRDGWKEKGRIPTDYNYSGFCILSVEPSDDSAILLEFNQKSSDVDDIENSKLKEVEEKRNMDEIKIILAELNSKIDKTEQFNETIQSQEKTIVELNEQITSKDTQITELNEKVSESEKTLLETNELIKTVQIELAECKKQNSISELNEKLSTYTEDEKSFAKEDIDAFNVDPTTVEINSIVLKIDAQIGKNAKASQIAEMNSKKETFKLDDIYSSIDSTSDNEGILNLDEMFK